MSEQPWEVIRRAADRLEELAKDASPGPWSLITNHRRGSGALVDGTLIKPPLPGSNIKQSRMVRPDEIADYKWVAALSPAVAESLVGWLRSAADTWENWGSRTLGPALDFAHKILGEQP